jgi:hypothetical protein
MKKSFGHICFQSISSRVIERISLKISKNIIFSGIKIS